MKQHLYCDQFGVLHRFAVQNDEVELRVGGACPTCDTITRAVTRIDFEAGAFTCETRPPRDPTSPILHSIPPKTYFVRPRIVIDIIRANADGTPRRLTCECPYHQQPCTRTAILLVTRGEARFRVCEGCEITGDEHRVWLDSGERRL